MQRRYCLCQKAANALRTIPLKVQPGMEMTMAAYDDQNIFARIFAARFLASRFTRPIALSPFSTLCRDRQTHDRCFGELIPSSPG
jgi:hypothetical protein